MGQRSIAEELTSQGYNALRFSHQTDANLIPAVEAAKKADIPGLNVNDAAIPPATNYVGNVPKGNGVHVAQWFIDNRPDGGQVAVIEGQSGVCAAGQCTAGFTETINASASSRSSPRFPPTEAVRKPSTPPPPSFSNTRT